MLGFTRKSTDGTHCAGEWVVALYAPLFPLRRYRLRIEEHSMDWTAGGTVTSRKYTILERTRLKPAEVLLTYLACWVLCPVVVLGPPALVFVGGLALGLPDNDLVGWVLFAIVFGWMCVGPALVFRAFNRRRDLPF